MSLTRLEIEKHSFSTPYLEDFPCTPEQTKITRKINRTKSPVSRIFPKIKK